MLRRITTPLVVMLLALSMGVPAASAQEPTYVYPCVAGEPVPAISPSDDIILRCAWGAKTEGLVRMFLDADVISFELKNESGNVVWSLDPEDAAEYWTGLVKIQASDFGLECKPDGQWLSRLVIPLGTLAAGTYTLTVQETYLHPINDAIHTCSIDGERIPAPSLYPAGPLPPVVTTIVVA